MSEERQKQSEIFDPAAYNGEMLLPESARRKIEHDEAEGFWIAKRLKEKKPEVYNLVKACRASGWTIRRTMDFCYVGYNTVVEIDRAEKDFFEKIKDQMAKNCYTTAAQLLDIVQNTLAKMSGRDCLKPEEMRSIVESFGKLVEKGQLLSGEATEIHETKETPKYMGWREMMNAQQGEVIEAKLESADGAETEGV